MNRTNPTRRPAGGQRQQGFVLVIVLVLLVVLTLLASAVALSGSRAVTEAQQETDRFQGELDMASTRDTVLFMLTTQNRNPGGLVALPFSAPTAAPVDEDELLWRPLGTEIALDARPYAGLGHARFAIQDDAGLLSPNWSGQAMMHAFFLSRGMDAGQWNELEAKRLDYQDADSLHRLGGAEADHYRRANRPPPTNRPIASPLEFRRILQWEEMLEGMDDAQLLGTLSSQREVMINLNTAPPAVLAMIPGMNDELAARLVALRRQQPILSTWSLRQFFPIPEYMEEGLRLFPNISGNLILWDRRFGGRRLAHWRLTPMSTTGHPWQIDYEVILPRDDESDNAMAETPASPFFAPEDPDRQGKQPPA